MDFGHKEWIERVLDLAHRYKCWRGYNDEANMRKLERDRNEAKYKGFPVATGMLDMQIKLLQTEMSEHEDISRALYEHAAILERLAECRDHIIPHKHDAEIIDYIETGKKRGCYNG